LISKPKI